MDSQQVFARLSAPPRHRVLRFLAEEVLAGGGRPLGDLHLIPGGDRDVGDLDCGIVQEVVEGAGDAGDAVLARRPLGRLPVAVVAGQNAQPGLLVGGQVGVVDDAAAADETDPVVVLWRQRNRVVDLVPGQYHPCFLRV